MKLPVVLCLFAVYCSALANTSATRNSEPKERSKLREVLKELDEVKKSLEHSEKMLNTPPQDIDDCCCLSALQCFRANMQVQFNITERKQRKLYNSLKNSWTLRGLDFCNTGNANTTTCQACDSHPKTEAREFFNRLASLIQRGITKLTID